MRKKKKHSLLFYFVPIVIILYLVLNNIRIPIGKVFHLYVNNKYDNILRDLDITAGKINVNIFGNINIYDLRMAKPQFLFADKVSLDVSVISWLLGSLRIQQLECDSILVAGDEAIRFLKETQSYFSRSNKLIKGLHSNAIQINVNKAVMRHSDPPEYTRGKNLSIYIKHPGKIRPEIKLSLKDISHPNWPDLSKLYLEGDFHSPVLNLSEIVLYLPSGKISSSIRLDTKELSASGQMGVKKLSLDKLTREGFFGDSQLHGELEAKLNFHLPLPRLKDAELSGHVFGKKIRAVNLPVQKDPVIENFMPAFKDLTFSKLRLLNVNLEGNKIKFDTLLAEGDPLSLKGNGYVTHEGRLYFYLNCFITKAYFDELKGVVKDAMIEQEDGRYRFQCEVAGNFKHQKIKMGKIIGQVFKSNLRRIGRGIKNLFK